MRLSDGGKCRDCLDGNLGEREKEAESLETHSGSEFLQARAHPRATRSSGVQAHSKGTAATDCCAALSVKWDGESAAAQSLASQQPLSAGLAVARDLSA